MNVINLKTIDSTNNYIKEHYEEFENFTFVSANFQTNGKGRENRIWNSNENENLLFSFLIKDKFLLKNYKALSIGTASLIGGFLEEMGLNNVMIKWPNDIYVNNKKICGILLEGNVNKYIVIGVGLNVNQEVFDGIYSVTPTSIKKEINQNIDINSLKILLFEYLMKHINNRSFKSNSLKFYRSHDYLLGKKITINNINGKVDGISDNFDLIINKKYISSGEVI